VPNSPAITAAQAEVPVQPAQPAQAQVPSQAEVPVQLAQPAQADLWVWQVASVVRAVKED